MAWLAGVWLSFPQQGGSDRHWLDFIRKNGEISYCFFPQGFCRFRRRCLTEGSLAAVAETLREKTVRNPPFLTLKSNQCLSLPPCCGKESHTPASHANHSFPFHASAPPHPHLQETLFMPKSQIALKFPPENVILMKNQEERNGKHGKSGAGRDEKQREVYCI